MSKKARKRVNAAMRKRMQLQADVRFVHKYSMQNRLANQRYYRLVNR